MSEHLNFQVLSRELVHLFQKNRPDMEIERMIFQQDDAPIIRAYYAVMTTDFDRPDLVPMNLAEFPQKWNISWQAN